jgi:hypothetical protein
MFVFYNLTVVVALSFFSGETLSVSTTLGSGTSNIKPTR